MGWSNRFNAYCVLFTLQIQIMTKTTKIVLGVGAIALAYYLYTKRNKGGATSTETPSAPQNTGDTPKVIYCKDGFKKTIIENKNIQNIRYANPCEGHGGIDELKTNGGGNPISEPSKIPNAYRLKEDFSQIYPTGSNVSGVALFRKGQIISAMRNPYLTQVMAVGQGSLTTTIKGETPNFQMQGQIWVNIPERILEKL
jgi:hypothetical protein